MPLDGKAGKQKWVLILSDGSYIVGSFDGEKMYNEAGDPATIHDLQTAIVPGGNFYATMTWYNMPPGDHRRVQIAWMGGNADLIPGKHFSQQMSLPLELTLHSSAEGSKLHMFPAREIESLRGQDHAFTNVVLTKDSDPLAGLTPDAPLDVEAEIRLSDAAHIEFSLRGYRILYDAGPGTITFAGATCPKLMISRVLTQNGILRLRMIIDRGSMEVFANDGELYAPMLANIHAPPDSKLSLLLKQGAATVLSMHVHELNSIWP
jgi:fructan beta-fructosidase